MPVWRIAPESLVQRPDPSGYYDSTNIDEDDTQPTERFDNSSQTAIHETNSDAAYSVVPTVRSSKDCYVSPQYFHKQ